MAMPLPEGEENNGMCVLIVILAYDATNMTTMAMPKMRDDDCRLKRTR